MKKLIVVLSVVAGAAHGGIFWDGNRLLSKMLGNSGEQMQALGYVMGVSDAMESLTLCTPNNVTAGQMHDIVKQYLEVNPGSRHIAADLIVNRALSRYWACEKKGTSL